MSRLRTELDDLREKHRDRDRTREDELQSTKERLQLTQNEKVSFLHCIFGLVIHKIFSE